MRKAVATLAILALMVAGWAVVRRHEVARAVLVASARLAGYELQLGDLRVDRNVATFSGVRLSRDGRPILDARRIDVGYNLRDLLPGSAHRFGLRSVTIDGPLVTISRDASGNYNVAVPAAQSAGPALPAAPDAVPLKFAFAIRDGSVDIRAADADPGGRHFRIGDVQWNGEIDSSARSHYVLDGAFLTQPRESFHVAGTVDVTRGYAMHDARAARIPLRELADFFITTKDASVLAGSGTNFSARLYALGVTDLFGGDYHASVAVDATGVAVALSLMTRPIEDLNGHVDVIDDAFFTHGLDATLAKSHFRASGSIYDFADPKLQLRIDGEGDLADLREAFAFAKAQPVSGATTLHVGLSGALADPVIGIHADAPNAKYANVPFENMHAAVAINHGIVAFLPLRASYGGADVLVLGSLDTNAAVVSNLVVHLGAPADRLPFLGELLGSERVVGDAIVTGTDLHVHARGAFASVRGIDRLGALAVADPNGTASVAPFRVHAGRGRFDGGYALDRPDDTSAFWGYASDVALHAPAHQEFPGLTLPSVPPIDTRVTDAQIAGTGSGRHVAVGGAIDVGGADIAGVRFDRIKAGFAGTMAGAEITSLSASGPWGTFDGRGSFSTKALIARGVFNGTLDGLEPFLGGIAAHGAVSGTAAIALQDNAVVVQADNLALQGASIHGIPISHVNGTMSIRDGLLRVYSGHARTAGGDVVVAGTYAVSPGVPKGTGLSLIASGLDGGQLRGLGLPLTGGRISSAGTLQPGDPLPAYDGTFALQHGSAAGIPIAGTGVLAMAGNGVKIGAGVVALGGSFAFLNGSIGALSSSAPSYDLHATIPAADVAGSLHALRLPNYETQGTFAADLAVSGSGLDPHVRGPVVVGGGDVNGLSFVNGRATIAAGGGSVSATNGGVLFASTFTQFDAMSEPQRAAIRVSAPVADLSDFNNFFDTGDTLDGSGSIAFHADVSRDNVRTGGNVDIAKFRYRNLPIGDTRARWSSASSALSGTLSVGGEHGRLDASGSIGISPAKSWQAMVLGSRYDVSATMSNLDLSLWIAAFGFPQIPITGRANGEARIDGRYPNLSIRGSTSVLDGTFGRLPIDSFELSGHSNGRRVDIDGGSLAAPGLAATASGNFGLQPDSPVDLKVHASSDDLPMLMSQFTHAQPDVVGNAELTVAVGGTLKTPTVSGAFDAQKVSYRGLKVDSLFGQLRLKGSTLELGNAGAELGGGQVTLAGDLPLQLDPFGVGPASRSLGFDVQVAGVNPDVLSPVLGNGTKLGGEIDGHFGLAGTVGEPRIFGNLGLTKGSYVSDLQRTPITDTVASIVFGNQSAQLKHFSSRLGNGSLSAAGTIAFGASGNAVYSLEASASNAQLDFPAYGSGTIDGKFALERQAHHDALLSGKVALENATILFSALAAAASGKQGGATAPLPFNAGLNLDLKAGNNVRVRGGSGLGAGLDIGATGSLAVTGSVSDPVLDGTITSTGGTLTYFDRAFRVRSGTVVLRPDEGLITTLNAVATTNVVNPDPDPRRNPFGTADVTITVDGRVDNLNIKLDSNPPGYSQEQILALIAPFGGFVAPIAFQTNGPYPQRTVNQITVGQEAFNILNAQFSNALLSPLESALGSTLGLSDVNLTLSYYGNVGLSARRVLGKNVSFTYARTFGIPSFQSFGLVYNQGGLNSAQVSFFNQSGASRLTDQNKAQAYPGLPLAIGVPDGEGSGFSFTFQRFFR